ncbi:MAG: hypothetical protein KAJ52_07680, partial [Sedimentisphaerales bacterium]|nr:hypothetical protein [Sedimentisphaerales bacterium]
MAQSFHTNRLDHRAAEIPVFEGYQITSRLGVGAGSVIYAIRSKKNNEMMALKHVMRQDAKDKRLIEQVENEYHVSQMVDYPYIRKIHKIKRVRRRLQTREVFLLMEYCSGI